MNNRLFLSSHRHSCLVTDHFLFEGGLGKGGGGVWQIRKQNSCATSAEEIKIVHSGTKQRNTSRASGLTSIQLYSRNLFSRLKSRESKFLQKKIAHPIPFYQMHNGPSLTVNGISYAMKIVHDFISVREINIVRTAISFSFCFGFAKIARHTVQPLFVLVTEAVKMHQK